MKPAWDQLAEEFKGTNVNIHDVDCTAAGENICKTVGVQGYPTIKYFVDGDPKGKDYNGGRSFEELKKFVEDTFKAGCDPATKENCNPAQVKIIDEFAGKSMEDIQEVINQLENEANAKKEERNNLVEEGKKKLKEMKAEEEKMNASLRIIKKFSETKEENDRQKEEL